MGKLYIVATPIGNLSDISSRALETLRNVDIIAAEDTRRTLQLLNYFDIKKKLVSYHKYNEDNRGNELIEQIINENIDIAIVSDAGTPCISDPGCAIVNKARISGVEVVAIPGASSVISALSVCGFDFSCFSFLGFIPRIKKDKDKYIDVIANSDIDTCVIFESPNRIIKSLKEIADKLPNTRIFVINDITKYHEKSLYGTIFEVINQLESDDKSNLGEYTIVLKKENIIENLEPQEKEYSIEAQLVNEIIESGCTLKEAIEYVCNKNTKLAKNNVYKASLNLKNLFLK